MSETQKKKTTSGARSPAAKKQTAGKKTTASSSRSKTAAKPAPTRDKKANDAAPSASSVLPQLMPILLMLLAVLLMISLVWSEQMGLFGKAVSGTFFGLFGGAGYLVPLLLVLMALTWKKDLMDGTILRKPVSATLLLLFTDALLALWHYPDNPHTFSPSVLWRAGTDLEGGGAIGGFFGELLFRLFSTVGTPIVSITVLLLSLLILCGMTPNSVIASLSEKWEGWREEMLRRREEAEEEEEEKRNQREVYRVHPPIPKQPEKGTETEKEKKSKKKKAPYVPEETERGQETASIPITVYGKEKPLPEPEEPVGDDDDADEGETEKITPLRIRKRQKSGEDGPHPVTGDEPPIPVIDDGEENALSDEVLATFAEQQRKKREEKAGGQTGEPGETPEGGETDLTEDDFALAIRRLSAMEGIAKPADPVREEEEEPKPVYILPPISLLNPNTENKEEDVSDELNSNAEKLVETLRSFKVRTRIVAISRGPTITRYELVPEEGVRVRAIANLVDDISLNLATSGVRIEAPIPGKSAVGIEVPNQNVATVFLRDLIDTPKFRAAQSLLTTCLGMDVAGEPVYLDVVKMPHLLIAGATGMGKSVCINSLIVSLLYKATPDQVKLIMIDPKKVELKIYNGLPHLLIPVVSDSKKAAGALSWAVTEMERRFELIEFVGARDIRNYNRSIEGDPTKEVLSQIVIVIDELADLMMTAPDEVETSICRLAQKGRAAGMHLIVGTQRPSTDVITGLIKANIPSRIAFTVSSQVDSRVILDMAGADKLIGRGDMLYAPVGSTKPIRVQGAFVSEDEVEAIVSFIRDQGEGVYDTGVMDTIEREAARCGNKRSTAFGEVPSDEEGGDDNDPMLKPAIELAVEAGKISTSLIQRRLSLGYGRSAKLIDRMEKMGIVSPPEGTKPRNVLITKEQYMEMVVSGDN